MYCSLVLLLLTVIYCDLLPLFLLGCRSDLFLPWNRSSTSRLGWPRDEVQGMIVTRLPRTMTWATLGDPYLGEITAAIRNAVQRVHEATGHRCPRRLARALLLLVPSCGCSGRP